MIYVNFISGSGGSSYFQPLLDAAREAKYVVGGPDSTYLNPTTGRQYINGTLGKIDYRGKIGIQVGDQASGLGNSDYVVEDLINWGINQGANYFFWQYMPQARNFNPIMDYLSKNPNSYVSRYPTEL